MPNVERELLYERSDRRFERVFDALVIETEALLAAGATHDWLQSIGLDYRFASYFLTRRMNREIAIAQFQQASRQYIRRQLTWWRHHSSPLLVSSTADACRHVREFAERTEFDTV
jgi:tRNA dimethylallyltransferase